MLRRSFRRALIGVAVFAGLALFLTLVFCVSAAVNQLWALPRGAAGGVRIAKAAIEVVAAIFAAFYALVALSYTRPRGPAASDGNRRSYSRVVVAYLCCSDLDQPALASIAGACRRLGMPLLIHDDSPDAQQQAAVDAAAAALSCDHGLSVNVIRRSDRVGGKPGALNNLMRHLPEDAEFLLLCDSDSFLPAGDFLAEALAYFAAPAVALVQFRNVGQVAGTAAAGYGILSLSVDFYDAFVRFADRFGWSPFLGHNALLRVSALREVGGFTPGQLADDIDYSVRLRLRGYRICYAREIAAGERHPASYLTLRRRTRKWTYGCTQILLRWGLRVLVSHNLTLLEKINFFLTVGFYHFQLLLLSYLVIFYLVLPFLEPSLGQPLGLLWSAGLILFFTFMPSITYFARNRILSAWPRVALCWGFTYGSQDFVMLSAAFGCLFGRPLGWLPTNGVVERTQWRRYLPEVGFGALILAVAALREPVLLLLPTTLLFAGKFICAPWLDGWLFREGKVTRPVSSDRGIYLKEESKGTQP